MSRWARLTWQSADPAGLSAGLERRLGVPGRDGGLVEGARLLHLGTAELEVRAWHSEGPHDTPRREGRLVLEPVIGGEPAPGPPETGAVDLVLLGLGWATVELERAEAELDVWLAPGASTATPDDRQLGARTRVRRAGALPGGLGCPAGALDRGTCRGIPGP